jgi:hypothetical protein
MRRGTVPNGVDKVVFADNSIPVADQVFELNLAIQTRLRRSAGSFHRCRSVEISRPPGSLQHRSKRRLCLEAHGEALVAFCG